MARMTTRVGHWTTCGSVLVALSIALGCGTVADNKPDAGGGSDDSGVTGDFSLAVVPTTLSVPIASSGTVTLHVERTGTVGDIMLSAPNLPAGVTASFATNPLPEGTDSTEVTFEIAGGTMPLTTDVTLRGTAGSLTQSTTLQLSATTITVTGKIRGGTPNVTVRIVGKQSVLSDASGNFTFTDVIPPYDLYVVGTTGLQIPGSSAIPAIAYYDDLTRPDPTVTRPLATTPFLILSSSAPISGTKSGVGNTTNPIIIQWSNGGTPSTAVTGAGSFSHTASWGSSNTNSGTLYGLEFTRRPSGFPNTIVGFGSTNATLTASQHSVVNLIMAAASSYAVTGTITAPSGFPNPTITLTQQFGNTSAVLHQTTGTDAAATLPVISAGNASIHASTSAGGATTSYVHPLSAAADVSINLPAPAVQVAPIHAATNVDHSTAFTFTAPAGVVSAVRIISTSTSGTGQAAYFIYTTSDSVTIPDVSEVPLPPNQSMSWSVEGYGPYASVNDVAGVDPMETVSSTDFTGPKHFFTSSTTRDFTSAP